MSNYMSTYYPTFAAPNCRGGASYWGQQPPRAVGSTSASDPAYDPRIQQLVVEGRTRRGSEQETVQASPMEISKDVELFTPHPSWQCIMPYQKEKDGNYFLVPTASIHKVNLPEGTLILPQGSQYYLKEAGERCARPFQANAEYAVLSEDDFASLKGDEPKARFRRSDQRYSYTWRPLTYRLFRSASQNQPQVRQSGNCDTARPQCQSYSTYYSQRSGV